MDEVASTHRGAALLWIVLLTAASIASTFALACMTPFAALAALAATQLRAREGVGLMLVAWGASQAIGFGCLGYPTDPLTLAWGAALGVAALGAVGAALAASRAMPAASAAVRLAAAFAAAFIGFKLVLLAADVVLGGPFSSTIGASVLLAQVPREAGITVALLLMYRGLVAVGLPAAPAPRRVAFG